VRRLTQVHPRLVAVHVPVHASWLNQIEIYFSIVQRKALRGPRNIGGQTITRPICLPRQSGDGLAGCRDCQDCLADTSLCCHQNVRSKLPGYRQWSCGSPSGTRCGFFSSTARASLLGCLVPSRYQFLSPSAHPKCLISVCFYGGLKWITLDAESAKLLIYKKYWTLLDAVIEHSHCRGSKFETCTAHQEEIVNQGLSRNRRSFFYARTEIVRGQPWHRPKRPAAFSSTAPRRVALDFDGQPCPSCATPASCRARRADLQCVHPTTCETAVCI
jgi:hypothetical protein